MGDQSDIQRLLAETYGNPDIASGYQEFLQDRYRFPETQDQPEPRASLRNLPPRPDDPLLRQNTQEAVAASLGQNLAHRQYGMGLLDAMELAAGAFPGAKGKGRGPKASEGATRQGAGPGAAEKGLPERGGLPGGDRGLPPSRGLNDPYVAVPGQPSIAQIPGFGDVEARPIPQIEMAARNYATKMGRPYEVAASFPPPDPERGLRIALAYEAMRHDPTNPEVRRAYDAMMEETLGQYRALKDQGLTFIFNEPGQDPYARSPSQGYMDISRNGRLSIFPTVEGYGSAPTISKEALENAPLLRDSGEKFGDKPALMNDLFRAVHDAYGHFGPGNPFFRAAGEDRAFGHHQVLYGPEAWPAITSELRGQNSFVNYHPRVAAHNKGASGANTIYADQKVGIMPPWTWQEGLPERGPGPSTEEILRMIEDSNRRKAKAR